VESDYFLEKENFHVLFYTAFIDALILIILKGIKNKIKLFLMTVCLPVIFLFFELFVLGI
jgi:hypothetical protein